MWFLVLVAAAKSNSGGTDWITPILSAGGPFALFCVLWVTDKISNNSERNALRLQAKELESDLRTLHLSFRTDVIPLITRSNDLIERQGKVVERALSVLERRDGQ